MKPSDFQLGVLEFFAVLIPGAVTAWLLWRLGGVAETARELLPQAAEARWAGFALVALALGQVLERLGALLDPCSDALRKLLWPHQPSGPALAAMTALRDAALSLAPEPKAAPQRPGSSWTHWMITGSPPPIPAAVPLLAGGAPVNVHDFAGAVLRARAPIAWADLERRQALSKLFRSLTAALLLLLTWITLAGPATRDLAWAKLPAGALVFGAGICCAIFVGLRAKAIDTAYRAALLALVLPERPTGPIAGVPAAPKP